MYTEAWAYESPPTTVYARATVTSSERLTLPADCIGKYVSFEAEGQDIWIVFGAGALTASKTAVSSLGGTTPAAATNGTWLIPAGQTRRWRIPTKGVTDLAHISGATTGFLRIYPSTGKAT